MTPEPASFEPLIDEIRSARLPSVEDRRRIRDAVHVSLRAASEALGVSAMTLWRWETGHAIPDRSAASRYREFLDALVEVTHEDD